jgi:hypothetical protein
MLDAFVRQTNVRWPSPEWDGRAQADVGEKLAMTCEVNW